MAEGLLLVDKPSGMTSHDVVAVVRRIAGIRRVGHAGTLDPLATGLLVLSCGRATRLIEYLVGTDKTYEATIRLGQATDSYDSEGVVTATAPVNSTAEEVAATLARFVGQIEQRPPRFSAVKRDGRRAYKLARAGEEFELPTRPVTIHSLELLSFGSPELRLGISCSSGTYIRSLAHDIGQELGCGGHITALRRSTVGRFQIADSVPLNRLTAENIADHLLPVDTAAAALPELTFDIDDAKRLMNGLKVARTESENVGQLARAYSPGRAFLGIVAAEEGYWRPRKMFVPPVKFTENRQHDA